MSATRCFERGFEPTNTTPPGGPSPQPSTSPTQSNRRREYVGVRITPTYVSQPFSHSISSQYRRGSADLNLLMRSAVVDPNLCDLDVAPIAMVVDCRALYINHRNRAKGHLGYHHWNVAAVLMSEELRPWRVMRYLELVAMLNSPAMMTEGKSASALTFCEKGCHRSVIWMFVLANILQALGFNASEYALCRWSQAQQRCQNGTRNCADCDPGRNPHLPRLGAVAVSEFYDVLLEASRHSA